MTSIALTILTMLHPRILKYSRILACSSTRAYLESLLLFRISLRQWKRLELAMEVEDCGECDCVLDSQSIACGMKIAIIGGGVTGCASAHYIFREYSDSLSNPSRVAPPSITLFEQSQHLGGSKFHSITLPSTSTPSELGRISSFEITSPYARDLLKHTNHNAHLQLTQGLHHKNIKSSAIYNYSRMKLTLHYGSSFFFNKVFPRGFLPFSESILGSILYRFLAGLSVYVLWNHCLEQDELLVIALEYFAIVFLSIIVIVGVFTMSDYFDRQIALFGWTMSSQFNYSKSSESVFHAQKEWNVLNKELFELKADRRCLTVVHMLSRCGLGRLSLSTASELVNFGMRLYKEYVSDVVVPNVSCGLGKNGKLVDMRTMSALAMKFQVLRCDDVAGRNYLGKVNAGGSEWCKSMVESSGGSVKLGCNVCAVRMEGDRNSDGVKYAVEYLDETGQPKIEVFDAVVIAATLDLDKCAVDLCDDELDLNVLFGYTESSVEFSEEALSRACASRYGTVVKGRLNLDFFGGSFKSEESVPDLLSVVNCDKIARIERLSDGVYQILSSDNLEKNTGLCSEMFKQVEEIHSVERSTPHYQPRVATDSSSLDIPSFLLSRKLLYANAVHRLGDHVDFDIMAARNIAFFLSP
eukprot:CAMPEP_0182442238 /NCGR_PEP_ID=MMETSP1172-20130603/1180_1 /TAXON_ID=708627 /ORGANISM="Timspurckia oligopyrenoides, Strain CCMP3278" /LENGTH=638 /DNA_ID=CAMNT_0024636991 /DNA_START=611 /DNA_END=2523 /DNA_ORIENTATION=-